MELKQKNAEHRKLLQIISTIKPLPLSSLPLVCSRTKGGLQQCTLLIRVLRRVLEIAFEKVLRSVARRCRAVGFNAKKGSEKGLRTGSKKGLSRRYLEGRNTPFLDYDPLGVRPIV